jgi:uncharacterized protein YecE (DUF72 family)
LIGETGEPHATVPPIHAGAPVTIRVGCSGWVYRHWRSRFYPAALPSTRWLEHYARQFNCVETNGTFYRLPEAHTFADWAARTPPGFRLAVKASRYLTHMKRLIEPQEPLERLLSRVAALGTRLGPVLYQLPPDLQRNDDRLRQFVDALPAHLVWQGRRRRLRHVLEFRHPSWYTAATYDTLSAHGVSLCLHDKLGSGIEAPSIGPLTDVRFHGASGRYHGRYRITVLERWAARLTEEQRRGRAVWALFNNDPEGAAIEDARSLRALIGGAGSTVGTVSGPDRQARPE